MLDLDLGTGWGEVFTRSREHLTHSSPSNLPNASARVWGQRDRGGY